MFRLEQMDKGAWWAAAIRGKQQVMFTIWWDKAKRDIVVQVYEDSIPAEGATDAP